MRTSFKSAFIGFVFCAVAAIVGFGALYLFGAPYLIETKIDAWTQSGRYSVSEAEAAIREDALWVVQGGAKTLITLFAFYWGLAGLFGMRRGLNASLANALLIAGTTGLASLSVNRFFYWIEGYCDELPFPHEGFQILKIYECPSSATFMVILSFFSIALFVVSLILRVIHSRKGQGELNGVIKN